MLVFDQLARRCGRLGNARKRIEFSEQADHRPPCPPFGDEGGRDTGDTRTDGKALALQFIHEQTARLRLEITEFGELPDLLRDTLGPVFLRFDLCDRIGVLRGGGRGKQCGSGGENG